MDKYQYQDISMFTYLTVWYVALVGLVQRDGLGHRDGLLHRVGLGHRGEAHLDASAS